MSWKYQECFMLITGILSLQKDFIKRDVFHVFSHSGKIQHPLTWNTAFPSLCLDLHGCAQLLASILLSLAFPGRSRNKSRAWEKWPWPGQAFPHVTSLHRPGSGDKSGLHSSYAFRVSGLMIPETKPNSHQPRRSTHTRTMKPWSLGCTYKPDLTTQWCSFCTLARDAPAFFCSHCLCFT